MNTIKVQYKVKSEFAEQNKTNILAVMEELKSHNESDIHYTAFCADDDQSFVHIYSYLNEEDEGFIAGLDAFQKFRAALKEAVVVSPASQKLSLVGSSDR